MQVKVYPYDNRYKVYEDGTIVGAKGKVLKPSLNHGYAHVMIGRKSRKVHQVVCHTFLDIISDRPDVNHKNGIKHDNRLSNLEWSNDSLNIRHAFENGLASNKGEKNPRCKIKLFHVNVIREAINAGHSPISISKYYKVHQNTIYQIKYNKNWKGI